MVGSLFAVKGVRYAGVLLLECSPPHTHTHTGLQRVACVLALAKGGRVVCMVSLEYFIKYLIEINAISDG